MRENKQVYVTAGAVSYLQMQGTQGTCLALYALRLVGTQQAAQRQTLVSRATPAVSQPQHSTLHNKLFLTEVRVWGPSGVWTR